MRYNEDVTGQGFNIPASYKVPFVTINLDERTEDDLRRERQSSMGSAQLLGIGGGRPRKMLYIVSFKCSRVDVFYLLDNTGLTIREGDLVIVEADRGQDLGTVQHCNVTPDQARLFKRKYSEEQYKWLMMFSRNNQPSNVNPNAQLYGENSSRGAADSRSLLANAPATMQGLPRENFNNLKPKAIKRLANQHEIRMLGEKEGNEAKAKRACQQKVAHLHLQMEILDAEWQWDFQKLIFYYYADHYINFKDLITDLYRIYKTRIWLSAVNPASFSQHAMGQPPSGIGPGAITGYGNNTLNNTYTMAYGPDPDPYGAVPPYRIGYETYNPNYPSIPGVTNSFAPGAAADNRYPASSGPFHAVTEDNNGLPTVAPGEIQTGATSNYHYFYDRSGNNEHLMSPIETPAMTPAPTHATQASAFNPYANFYYPGAITPQASENYSPWNNNAAAHQASASLGRPAQLPQPPIGTRPASNGNAQTPNSATRNSYFEETVRPYRDSQQSATYDSQLRQATNSIGDMNLRPSSKYADEMSRER